MLLKFWRLFSSSSTSHPPPTAWGLHEIIFIRHLVIIKDYIISFIYKCIFIWRSVKWIFFYASILFHFDICLCNKSLGPYSHICLFIHGANLKDDYLSRLCKCVYLFQVVNWQTILLLDMTCLSPSSNSGRICRNRPPNLIQSKALLMP